MGLNRFLLALFVPLVFSCSDTEQANDLPAKTIQRDSTLAPVVTVLADLADTLKPKIIFSDKMPKPVTGIQFNLPETIPLAVLKNKNGEISKDKEGRPFILGEGGISDFTTYTTDNGLALDAIACAIIDRTGNLWFGTEGGGVSRYNGESFTNFSTQHGLPNNAVVSILEDQKGNLWFGTYGGGVSCYDGRAFTNFTTRQGLAHNDVISIHEDKKGNIWFGTYGGLSRYDGRSFLNLTTRNGLANNNVWCICEDQAGNLWCGTEGGGVSRYNGSTFTNFTTTEGLPNNVVLSILTDRNGDLWFGTEGGGVARYNGTSFTTFTTQEGLANNNVWCITEDRAGNLWFGTAGGGASCYNGKNFTNYTTQQGLANNSVYSITQDNTGYIWFGTYGGGISRFDGRAFTNFTSGQGLANNSVVSIAEDKAGNLWFGNYGGVSCYDGRSFTNYTTQQGLVNNAIRCITADNKGDLWFGTEGGISRYNGKSFINYTLKQGLPNTIVVSIRQDKKGNLWIATGGGGIACYDGRAFTNFTSAQGLASNMVKIVAEDKNGNLWFGTEGGVSRYDGKTFMNFTTRQGLANNNVLSIKEDSKGNLWFGTDGGLSCLTVAEATNLQKKGRARFITYTSADGLPDDVVTQIVEGDKGKLYIGTNLGICELVPGVDKENYYCGLVYNSAKGYPVKDVNSGQNGMYKDSKGIIWIATGADKTGLVRFNPAALNKNTAAPNLVLQNVKIDEQTICWYDLIPRDISKTKSGEEQFFADSLTRARQEILTKGRPLSRAERDHVLVKFGDIQFDGITKFYPVPENLILPYRHNSVTISFVAVEPGKNFLCGYEYILEGYDKEWSPLTHKTEATFGNMYEGSYAFKVKARNPFGVWSKVLEYKFTVLPPWHRTWWMYGLYALATIAAIILIVRINSRKLRARASELKQKVHEATIEISDQKEQVEKQKKVVEEKHKEITDSINYAERIQRSFLASKDLLDKNLEDYFVFFQPKDVVSGDFYWASTLSNGHFALAVADSTGHGVPGAIMSILNISSLEKAVEQGLHEPAEILDHTRKTIIERLQKDGSAEGGKDGMDVSLICFDFANSVFSYAAANNPIWIVRKDQILDFTPDKMPVGKHEKDHISFTQQVVALQKGDLVYALTDGMPDQFGGPKGKKFMYKQLKELLLSLAHLSMPEQKEMLKKTLLNWKGNLEQVDDICLIGIRF